MGFSDDILNGFQRRVERLVTDGLASLSRQVEDRRIGREEPVAGSGSSETVLYLRAHEVELRIREDSMSYTVGDAGDYFEMADYRNAEALVIAFLGRLNKMLSK